MSTLQIRNVPDSVHRTVKARAASEGMSVSEYLLREVKQIALLPTITELSRTIEEQGRVSWDADVVAILHDARASR